MHFEDLVRGPSQFPFDLFGELVGTFLFTSQPKEVDTPEVQKLRKNVATLYSRNRYLEEMIQLLEGTNREMEYKHELKKKQIEDHWRKIVLDLERQLSQERMRKD